MNTLYEQYDVIDSLLFGCSKLISGGVELLHPVAALVSTVFQLLLQGANWRIYTQPLCLDPCVRLSQKNWEFDYNLTIS